MHLDKYKTSTFYTVCASFWRAPSLQIISAPSWKLLSSGLCSAQGSHPADESHCSQRWAPLRMLGVLLSTVTPPAWAAHDLDEAFSSSQLLHHDLTEAASVWQCVYKKEIQLVTNSFLQPHSMASGFSSLLQALPTGSPPDVSTTFNNCPIPCKLGPLERTDAFGYNPLHRCRGTLRKG